MSEYVRAFLAFDLDNEEVRKKLAELQRLLANTGADLKLVEPENIHITMRFLGDITLHTNKILKKSKKFSLSHLL